MYRYMRPLSLDPIFLHKKQMYKPLSRTKIDKESASEFVPVEHTHILYACAYHSRTHTYTLLQVVLQPADVSSDCPFACIKFPG